MNTSIRLTALALALTAGASFAQTTDTMDAKGSQPQPSAAPFKKGLTWGVYPADPITGTLTVSCQGSPKGQPGNYDCNPYIGDTPSNKRLPVLCFNPLGFQYPVPNVAPISDPSYWSGGVVATTAPVSPFQMGWTNAPRAVVDAYCAAQFGTGWVIAEHHLGNGNGWKFSAYGNVGKPGKQRFWVHINNQPNGNIWQP